MFITMPEIKLLPCAISEIFFHTSTSGKITLADRYGLMAAILDETLTEEDHQYINRVLRSVVRGKVKIVDEVSVIS